MNDKELDELLDSWKTPPVRGAWRESVQNRIAPKHRKPLRELLPGWKFLAAAASTGTVILLLANTSAFSRMLSPPPYTVDSEIRRYPPERVEAENIEDIGRGSGIKRSFASPDMTLLVTSYNEAGSEVILSASFPNQGLKSLLGGIFLALWDAAHTFKQRFILPPDEEAEALAVVYPSSPRGDLELVVGRREELMSSGCRTSKAGAKVTGQDVILNYPVTGVQLPWGELVVTLWMAPELSCFALRATIHGKQPDGAWKLIYEKQALQVTVNR